MKTWIKYTAIIWHRLLFVVLAGWVLYHLVLISTYGKVTIQETNGPVLHAEIILMGMIVTLGLFYFVKFFVRD